MNEAGEDVIDHDDDAFAIPAGQEPITEPPKPRVNRVSSLFPVADVLLAAAYSDRPALARRARRDPRALVQAAGHGGAA